MGGSLLCSSPNGICKISEPSNLLVQTANQLLKLQLNFKDQILPLPHTSRIEILSEVFSERKFKSEKVCSTLVFFDAAARSQRFSFPA